MLHTRLAVAATILLVPGATAGTVTFLTQSRSVHGQLEYHPSGSPPVTQNDDRVSSGFGLFDETVAISNYGYESDASQTSNIATPLIQADGSIFIDKPFLGTDMFADQQAGSYFSVEFETFAATSFQIDLSFAFSSDTGGTSIAFGSIAATLTGADGDIFHVDHSFPLPDNYMSVDYADSGSLEPGVYSLAVYAEAEMSSWEYDIGGSASASYSLGFQFVPEPATCLTLALVASVALRRR